MLFCKPNGFNFINVNSLVIMVTERVSIVPGQWIIELFEVVHVYQYMDEFYKTRNFYFGIYELVSDKMVLRA